MSSGWVAACSAVSWICSFTACLACIPDLDPFSKKARQKSLVMNCALDGKSTKLLVLNFDYWHLHNY